MANIITKAAETVDPRNLNQHDLRVVLFHCAIIAAQAFLIQFGVEKPEYALFGNTIAELLRRIVV